MKLSPLYEALIFIEDQKKSSLSDLSFLPNAVLRGILGKMEAMKLIEKMEVSFFKISPNGQALLNKYLDNLHKSTLHWDGYWRLVCFSVPETNRPARDKFRRELESMGLRMILTGLWMTPLDLEEEIKNKAIQMGIFSNVLIFKTNEIISGLSVNEFAKLWNFEKSKEEIYKYIEDAEKYLVQPDKKNFETKKMIFRYALILENQPKLPIELFPKDWPQFRASLIYKKVRRSLPV
jgi:phenylacetic acid degradation operon negative regulatory protein